MFPLKLISTLDVDSRPGPPTQFKSWHLLAALLLFSEARNPIGRYQLGDELGLGRGSVRSLVKFLRRRDFIHPVKRRGHELSIEGQKYVTDLSQVLVKIVKLPQSAFTVDQYNFGCHLRNRAHLVTDGVSQRDAALRAGASGATTLVQESDPESLVMPVEHRVSRLEAISLLEHFNLREKDVLLIGSGSSWVVARLGTLAASITLLDE